MRRAGKITVGVTTDHICSSSIGENTPRAAIVRTSASLVTE